MGRKLSPLMQDLLAQGHSRAEAKKLYRRQYMRGYFHRYYYEPGFREHYLAERRLSYREEHGEPRKRGRPQVFPDPQPKPQCFNCKRPHTRRAPLTVIERLLPINGDLVPRKVPWCGRC
jgi:hypothetical protein